MLRPTVVLSGLVLTLLSTDNSLSAPGSNPGAIAWRVQFDLIVTDVAEARQVLIDGGAKCQAVILHQEYLHRPGQRPRAQFILEVPTTSLEAFLDNVGANGRIVLDRRQAEDLAVRQVILQNQLRQLEEQKGTAGDAFPVGGGRSISQKQRQLQDQLRQLEHDGRYANVRITLEKGTPVSVGEHLHDAWERFAALAIPSFPWLLLVGGVAVVVFLPGPWLYRVGRRVSCWWWQRCIPIPPVEKAAVAGGPASPPRPPSSPPPASPPV